MEKDLAEEMVDGVCRKFADTRHDQFHEVEPGPMEDAKRGRRLLVEWIRALEASGGDDAGLMGTTDDVLETEEACREWLGLLPPGAPAADDEQRQ